MTFDNPEPPGGSTPGNRVALAVSLALILAATLPPAGPVDLLPKICLACGYRGLADFLLNVALFAPFGAALAARGQDAPRALLLGVLLSAGVETAQLWIPGRQTALGDVLANGAGSGLGALGFAWFQSRRKSLISSWVAAIVGVGVFSVTGVLLRPSYPASTYFGQWTAELSNFQHYGGRVIEARLGDGFLPPHRSDRSAVLRQSLYAGAAVSFRALTGPAPAGLAPIVSIFDDRQRAILVVGADGMDLVVVRRVQAAAWRLPYPAFRFAGALAGIRVGDTLAVTVGTGGSRLKARVNGRLYRSNAMTVGEGWSLLYDPAWAPPLSVVLDAVWVAFWCGLPAFLVGVRRRGFGAMVLVAVTLAGIPLLPGLAPTPLPEWAGAVLAMALGFASGSKFGTSTR